MNFIYKLNNYLNGDKKKLLKNIFTEIIKEKPQKYQSDEVKDNSNKEHNNNKIKGKEKYEESKSKRISQKNLKTMKKINRL